MSNLNILASVSEKIKDYIFSDNINPVVKYNEPIGLRKEIDFKIKEKGVSEIEFLELIDKYLDYSVKTGNKQFLNQLYAGLNFPAFIGEVITALTNTSMYTYEVAPVATIIEKEMIQLMNQYTGFLNGDGIFLTGGSNANFVAMFSARNQIVPSIRFDGYDSNLRLVAFVNEQAHYSFETAANILGIGSKSIIKVRSDENGSMIPIELEKAIVESLKNGATPFFVGATCGTTLLGAYDPLQEIAQICKQYNLWLHVDGSFGGSLIISKKYNGIMKGLSEADSFAWNPHKLMNIPLVCSALLVKKKGTLQYNITDINTDYIFHDIDNIEDLGKKSIQCGRRVDAVKLWFAWKYFGIEGYEKRIDNLLEMAKYAESIVKSTSQLQLLSERQSFSVCFRYVPNYEINLNEFNLQLRESLRKSGKSIVNFGYIGKELAIRLVTANGELENSDVDIFFKNLLFEADKLLVNYRLHTTTNA